MNKFIDSELNADKEDNLKQNLNNGNKIDKFNTLFPFLIIHQKIMLKITYKGFFNNINKKIAE